MNSFTISRTLKAARSLVFNCWTTPEHFEKWFSPAECDSRILYADVRPGGYFHQETNWPGGTRFYTKHEFHQISPIDKLIFTVSFCDVNGEFAQHPFSPDWPDRLLTTVTFEDDGPDTRVTVLWEPIESSAEKVAFFMKNLDSCHAGWSDTFDKVEKTVESLQPIK